MPAWGPSQGAMSRLSSSAAASRGSAAAPAGARRVGLVRERRARRRAPPSVCAPVGRTVAPAYSGAEAGTTAAGSAEVPPPPSSSRSRRAHGRAASAARRRGERTRQRGGRGGTLRRRAFRGRQGTLILPAPVARKPPHAGGARVQPRAARVRCRRAPICNRRASARLHALCAAAGRGACRTRQKPRLYRGFRAAEADRGRKSGRRCANRVALWEEVGYVRAQRAGVEGLLPLLHLGSVNKLGAPQWSPSAAPSTIRSTPRTASRCPRATAPRSPRAWCWRCRST